MENFISLEGILSYMSDLTAAEVFAIAKQDPKLEIDCITPETIPQVLDMLKDARGDVLVSEWRKGIYTPIYEYYVHKDGVRDLVIELKQRNMAVGQQRLTGAYTLDTLRQMVQSPPTEPRYQQDSGQIHHLPG